MCLQQVDVYGGGARLVHEEGELHVDGGAPEPNIGGGGGG